MLNSIKAVLFDLDGTLIDSYPGIRASFFHIVEKHQLKLDIPKEDILKYVGLPLEKIMLKIAGNESKARELMADYRAHNKEILPEVPFFPGCVEALEHLYHHKIAIGVVTSKSRDSAIISLEKHHLLDKLSIFIGKEDVHHHKPHPEPLQLALQKLAILPQQAAYLGDTILDIQCAKQAGCLDIAAMWGTYDRAGLLAENPSLALEDIQSLLKQMNL